MGKGMIIRGADRGDLPVLVDFNLRMAEETEGRQLDPGILEAGVAGVFDRPERGFYLVAEEAGRTVGSLMVTTEWSDWRNGDFWWVQSVYVRPEFRRQGVFGALYDEVRKMARQTERVCGCRLYLEKDNQAALASYLKRGFIETPYRICEDGF